MSESIQELGALQPGARVRTATRVRPTWWVVMANEIHGLWVGGKAPILLLLYSIVLGAHAFVTAYNVELSLMPPNEMVYETVKTAISVGIFLGMMIGADAISGERERGTLEALLLTPTRRRQVVIGKFLAALTPWPVAFVLTIPYLAVLGQGHEVLLPAIAWGAVLGTVLTVAYTGTGLLVSLWSNNNRTSYLVSLGIYILILVPSQLPGRAQTGAAGQFLQQVNPLAALNHFLSKILVNNRTFEEFGTWLLSPIIFATVVMVLLVGVSAPRLRLEAGRLARADGVIGRAFGRLGGLFVLVAALVIPAASFASSTTGTVAPSSQVASDGVPVEISVDLEYQTVNTGDAVFFDTVVTNPTDVASAPLIVAMNIINLDQEGDVVDPEDWSPERTQYVDRLDPGQWAILSWRVNAILDGDYIVYMVVMPQPAAADATSQAVASSGIHLTVLPFTRLNPGGVMPLVLGAPTVLAIGTGLILSIRRRETGGGGRPLKYLRLPVVLGGVVLSLVVLSGFAVMSQPPSAGIPGQSGVRTEDDGSTTMTVETLTGAEDFAYAQTAYEVPAGAPLTVELYNRTDPADEIGHNWVLVEPGQEAAVLASGLEAGDDLDWLDIDAPGMIAHVPLIEGGESNAVTFDPPPPGTYTFICTFPEHHAGGMIGTLTVVEP
ncbi:MAG: ABC transporter permease subunit [Chloroflexi bacterium]|nr:ABC transporter permease subunit [Chloroflexota bacterium]